MMRTPTYEGGDRRAARRTLSQAASVLLRMDHDIEAVGFNGPGAASMRQDWVRGRFMMAARLIAGKYDQAWEALALRT